MECPHCGAMLTKGTQKVLATARSHELARTREYLCLECNGRSCSVEIFLSKENFEHDSVTRKKHIKKRSLVHLLSKVYELLG